MNPQTITCDARAELAQQICAYIQAHLDESLTLEALGARFAISPAHLQRVFKSVVGVSPRAYASAQRMARFKERLKAGDAITDAIYEVGYGSTSRLYERADTHLGMTPSDYRRGGDGLTIRYALAECDLGILLVAATERGICALRLDDDPEPMMAKLVEEYPAAQLVHDNDGLGEWVSDILAYLRGWQPHLDLPLDIRVTAFQQRVLDELRRIPYGETRTYRQIAEAIGHPKAARAVGNACAHNPVPLVIPCHRVVRGDGDLGGYGLGIQRKRALLTMERES